MQQDLAGRIAALVTARHPAWRDVSVERVTPLSGGNARRVWSFDLRWTEDGAAHEGAFVILTKPEAGQLESDLADEYAVLEALVGSGVPAPVPLCLDADGAWIGAPAFITSRGEGKADIRELLNPVDPAGSRRFAEDLAVIAARLHTLDASRLRSMTAQNADASTAALVAQWEDTFRRQRLEPHPVMASLFGWLRRHVPATDRTALVHGDLRFGNFLYDGGRITMLVDWEMAHLGDPAEDIAWAYRPLWSPAAFLPLDDFVEHYVRHGGAPILPQRLLFWRVFSELKFATISLTAARSFADGKTRNLRFADRAAMVTECLVRCLDWIDAAPEPA